MPHKTRHQVELVVVNEHQRTSRRHASYLDDASGDLPVDLDVTLAPRLVDALVDHRLVGQVPQVVLDEPEHRVGEHRVIHLVLLSGRADQVQAPVGLQEWNVHRADAVGGELAFGIGTRDRNPIRAHCICKREQTCDHAARAAFEPSLGLGLVRRPVADDDR